MGVSKIDFTGRRRGRLTVLEDRGDTLLVRCDCGNEKTIPRYRLYYVESCGCAVSDAAKKSIVKNRKPILDFIDTYHTHPNVKTQRPWKGNKSGIKGVTLLRNGKYEAHLQFNHVNHYLGVYSTLRDAARARFDAEDEYLGALKEGMGSSV